MMPKNCSGDVYVEQLVLLGKALADPCRVRMLRLLAEGRGCCGLSPLNTCDLDGLYVCELQDHFNLGQSKVSYHLKILKEAGLVRETMRGKWTVYSLAEDAARDSLTLLQRQLKLD